MMVFSIAALKADNVEAYGEGAETMTVRMHYLGSTLDQYGVRQAIIEYEAALYESAAQEPQWYACFSDDETEAFKQAMHDHGYDVYDPVWYPIRETIKPYRR